MKKISINTAHFYSHAGKMILIWTALFLFQESRAQQSPAKNLNDIMSSAKQQVDTAGTKKTADSTKTKTNSSAGNAASGNSLADKINGDATSNGSKNNTKDNSISSSSLTKVLDTGNVLDDQFKKDDLNIMEIKGKEKELKKPVKKNGDVDIDIKLEDAYTQQELNRIRLNALAKKSKQFASVEIFNEEFDILTRQLETSLQKMKQLRKESAEYVYQKVYLEENIEKLNQKVFEYSPSDFTGVLTGSLGLVQFFKKEFENTIKIVSPLISISGVVLSVIDRHNNAAESIAKLRQRGNFIQYLDDMKKYASYSSGTDESESVIDIQTLLLDKFEKIPTANIYRELSIANQNLQSLIRSFDNQRLNEARKCMVKVAYMKYLIDQLNNNGYWFRINSKGHPDSRTFSDVFAEGKYNYAPEKDVIHYRFEPMGTDVLQAIRMPNLAGDEFIGESISKVINTLVNEGSGYRFSFSPFDFTSSVYVTKSFYLVKPKFNWDFRFWGVLCSAKQQNGVIEYKYNRSTRDEEYFEMYGLDVKLDQPLIFSGNRFSPNKLTTETDETEYDLPLLMKANPVRIENNAIVTNFDFSKYFRAMSNYLINSQTRINEMTLK